MLLPSSLDHLSFTLQTRDFYTSCKHVTARFDFNRIIIHITILRTTICDSESVQQATPSTMYAFLAYGSLPWEECRITSHRNSYKVDTASTNATYGGQSTTTSGRSSKKSHKSSSKGHKKSPKKPDTSSIETDLRGIGSQFSSSSHQAKH
jgi:hypothetical protein